MREWLCAFLPCGGEDAGEETGRERKTGISNNEIYEEKARRGEQERRDRKQNVVRAKQWQGQKKTKTIKRETRWKKDGEQERKTQRQMWVNETDNGKQWSMAWMIVFQGPWQIEQRTREVLGEWMRSFSMALLH